MQPTRTIIRSPQVCRLVRAPAATRSMSLFSAPPFVPRFPASSFPTFSNELAPFFRMMDDFASSSRVFDHFSPPAQVRQFQPRFDVREVGETYELRGELPGVESKNLEVEFTDAQTLVIRGRTESETTSGTPPTPTAAVDATEPTTTTNAVADNSDAASTRSASSYQKATVEDEGVAVGESSSTPGQATPAESEVPQQAVQATATPAEVPPAQVNAPRYWISERSTGSFQRVFNFPSRVNQDGVTASLKNGVLNVVVPKAVAPSSRRINVE